jgi:hypothetical protein
VEAVHEGLHGEDVPVGAVGSYFLRFLARQSDRLFAKDVFAGVCGSLRPGSMKVVGEREVDGIDFGVGEKLVVRSKALGDTELGCDCPSCGVGP